MSPPTSPTSIWWVTLTRGLGITPVWVVRETERCLWIDNGRHGQQRVLKASDYVLYHRTWEDAHAHLQTRAADRLASLRHRVDDAQREVETLKAMRPPKEPTR